MNSINVAVRVRPLSDKELALLQPSDTTVSFAGEGSLTAGSSGYNNGASTSYIRPSGGMRRVIKPIDSRVLVFDPPETSPVVSYQRSILGPNAPKKVKDIRFVFDRVFDESTSQQDVFEGCASELVPGVLDGFNSTVFAYGATGCGKTHTISGSPQDPGIIFRLMQALFHEVKTKEEEMTCEVSLSYLEIYNETIRDLLIPNSIANLNLRESEGRVVIPGLSEQSPKTAEEVVSIILSANANRAVSATEANAVSSRSHAVLAVNVKQKPRTAAMSEDYTMATLSIIDLAGSERASVTKNKGERLLEGANINRSLLALGNCINALCDPRKSSHVPYRDSKLTRLLKHSLGGNCRTLMVVCVSPSSQHYDETFNTLQYANRAKEIKTKVTRNVVSVDRHVSQYMKVILDLQQELAARKAADGDRERKWRAEVRSQSEKAVKEIQGVMASVRSSYNEVKDTIASIGALRAEQEALKAFTNTLTQFKTALYPPGQAPDISYTYILDNLSSDYASRTQNIVSDMARRENAKSMFEAVCASSTRKVSNPLGPIATQTPELLQLLTKELDNIKLEIQLASMQACERDAAARAKTTCSLLDALSGVRTKIASDISICSQEDHSKLASLEDLSEKAANAYQDAAAHLLSSGLAAMPSGQRSMATAANAGPVANPSKKRSVAARSPNPDTAPSGFDFARPIKMQRSSLAPTASFLAKRQSNVASQPQAPAAPRPSLKASTSALSRKNSNTSLPSAAVRASFGAASSSGGKVERKGVMWKDDNGDKLTEEHSKSVIEFSDTSGDVSNVLQAVPSGSATRPPIKRPLMASKLGQKSILATEAITEEDESSASLSSAVDIPERVLADMSNSTVSSGAGDDESFESDTTTIPFKSSLTATTQPGSKARSAIASRPAAGTPKKGASARRVSNIGPIRSAKKNRRVSHISMDAGDLSNASSTGSGAENIDTTTTAREPRRAGRTTLSFQNKMAAHAAEAAQRQAASSSSMSTSAAVSGVAARVAAARARRESMANAALGSVSGPMPTKSFAMTLDLNAANKPTYWR